MKNKDLFHRLADPEIINKVLMEGLSIQEVLEYTHEDIESFYEIGVSLFNQGKYEEASDVFFFLLFLNTHYPNIWFSHGLAEQRQNNHEEALQAFTQAIQEDPYNPDYYIQACYTCSIIGEYPIMLFFLTLLEEMVKDPDKIAPYQSKINAFKKMLEENT